MNPSTYQEIKNLFDNYIELYSTRNDLLTELFSADFSGFAGGGNNLVKDREEWIAVTRQDFAQVKEKIEIHIKDLAIQSLAENVAVATSFFTIKLPIKDDFFSREIARLVLIFHKEFDQWKIAHSSISIPYGLVGKGEIYPVKGVEERNKLLEQIISEKSNELENIHQALKASEKLYRSIIKASPENITITDIEGRILLVSPAGVAMFGRKSQDEYLGCKITDYLIPEERERWSFKLAERLQGATAGMSEYKALRLDGSVFDIEVNSDFIRDEDGRPSKIVVVVRDITERKHAEDEIKSKDGYQRALLDNFPFAVWLKDNESRFLAVNKMFAQTFGFPTPNELVGKTDFDIAAPDLAEGYRSDDLTVLESREKKNVEEEIVDQGVRKWFETYKAPVIDTNGELLGTVGFMRDINERKLMERALRESEERFRNVLQGVESVSIQGYSPDGTTQYWNRASELLYGYSAEEAIGRNLLDLIIPIEMRDGVEQAMLYMSETGQPIPASELSLRRKDGSRVFVYSSHTIVQIPGRQQELFCIDIDLTKRKATEQLLLDMQRRESLGILAGGIAHDFNNLLGSMMGNVSLAQANMPPGHPALKNMEKALSAMERAAHLTQQMLAYSGKGKFVLSTIDVGATVMEHKNLFTVSLPKNVKLITDIPSTPIHVNGDPGQIEQVVMNLIINGGEAVGDKQGVVSVSLGNVSMGAEELVPYGKLTNVELNSGIYALLEVKDSGRGMSLETLGKIFDPFFTTKFTGRGLGLAAVLGIIQGHQGGITVESDEGVGTTFRVVLPTFPAPVIAEEGETPDERFNTPVTTTVLVIDDEADVIAMAQEILETEHYKVLAEMNPIKGIQLYKQRQTEVGVVLLDLTMPEMSGKEVVDALQAINPAVKIIISSGYSEDEVDKKIGRAKVSGFIQKPYRLQSLLALVQSVIK